MTGGRKGVIGFLSSLFKTNMKNASRAGLKVIPASEHGLPSNLVPDHVLKVLNGLARHGHDAWLVGGCLRDFLLGITPKDFDVATSAHPEVVRSLFRNSRIIGRRFKLIHVLFGREIVEVATFRANQDSAGTNGSSGRSRRHARSGRILRDNVYGTIEEDALRRDFTVNALYYTATDGSLRDFCGGVQDLHNGVIRLIGDPGSRYREDPVRMLRALRFAARLDFSIEEHTAAAIHKQAALLRDIPPARLFDESLKLFLSGKGCRTIEMMREYGLLSFLFPATESVLARDSQGLQFLEKALQDTDARAAEGKPVSPAFLVAVLLWPPMRQAERKLQEQDIDSPEAYQQAAAQLFAQQCRYTAIPRRFSMAAREVWFLQKRLESDRSRQVETLLQNSCFRAAYDFLLLREAAGEKVGGAVRRWTGVLRRMQTEAEPARPGAQLADAESRPRRSRPRRRYRNRRPGGAGTS